MGVTAFAYDSNRKNGALIRQSTYVFAVVKKHLNV